MEKRKKEIKAAPSSQTEGAEQMKSLFPRYTMDALDDGKFWLDIRKQFILPWGGKPLELEHREAVGSPSVESFKTQLNKALRNLL